MDFKEIQELIRMVNKNNIAELTIENQDFRIKIKTALAPTGTQMVQQIQQPVLMPQVQQTTQEKIVSTTNNASANNETTSDNSNLITIKSPIVGTFYRSAGPDKDVFVKVGDDITQGTVLCIIEAMKLFNEIESDHSGKIVKILVEDASPVEYDQPLFLIEAK
jgi:acetyl-CoA carboxylase biotin carboxyl carrier protein